MKTRHAISSTSRQSSASSWRILSRASARNTINFFPNRPMRQRYSYSAPEQTRVDIGETHVTLREPSGRILTARILEKRTDTNGQITSVLLDRIIHERYSRI